jgi:hypothetical protein
MGIWRHRARRGDGTRNGWPRNGHRSDEWIEPYNAVARAAERMLSGEAPVLFLQRGRVAPPAWAYLNSLAHAGVEDLRVLAGAQGGRDPSGWAATVSYLAADMLAYERDADHIYQTQRDVLIPLELEYLDDRFVQPATPADFAGMVLRALEHHRTWRSQ